MTAPGVVVLDYGSGNLRSVERAVARAGAGVVVTADVEAAARADGVVVPGVGAYAACMAGLRAIGGPELVSSRVAGELPVLAICVGQQVLFDLGIEHGVTTEGCGQWAGTVERLHAGVVPHMGWNTVEVDAQSEMFAGVEDERFYFVHSYAARHWTPRATGSHRPATVAWTTHESDRFVAAVEDGSLWATQFHPEKSGDAGAELLSNWVQRL